MLPPLYHFSDDSTITVFEPRPVRTAAKRPPGREWLNGPLVWAIDEWHQPLYLFPRDCPRILLWRTPTTLPHDAERYFGESTARMVAFIEERWLETLIETTLYRYSLPAEAFTSLEDAGMWVSSTAVRPTACSARDDLRAALAAARVELRVLADLTPLRNVWDTTLHASGIRLRNAERWPL